MYLSERRVHALAGVKTTVVFHHRTTQNLSANVASNFLRFAKAITYSMRRAGLTSYIRLEVRWPALRPRMSRTRVQSTEKRSYMIRVSGGAITRTCDRDAPSSLARIWQPILEQFTKWHKQQARRKVSVAEFGMWEERWNVYEKFIIACRAFYLLKIVRSCHAKKSVHPSSEDVDAQSRALDRENLGRVHILLDRAREAFSNQEDETLLQMLGSMQALWSAINDRREKHEHKAMTSLFSITPQAPAERDDIEALAVLHDLGRPTWPEVPPSIEVPVGAVGKKVDELYECFDVDGKEVRKLIRTDE